ncbi:MAG TPA: pantoate--beta-alanine ligase [Bacteroidales bacterium]|nr:pantoate--beta-alanine ligase [Bacteroidales bacterium]HSA42149.1 pantoate--beta-alanine ligase [Bacteroidales bacterium]
MFIAETKAALSACFEGPYRGKTTGFVPTMGALHEGHLALVRQALCENETVVCSIFVNPVQFNNPDDLEKYPRTLAEDVRMLEQAGCHVLFHPGVPEMYPEPPDEKYDFGLLEQVMEGSFRPGHFNGVAIVVKRLFDLVKPDRAYFGEKDYQQLLIVKALVKMCHMPVEIVPCPTVREADGLAMSSRNRRLSPGHRRLAPVIRQSLISLKASRDRIPLEQAIQQAADRIDAVPDFRVEYLEVADAVSLKPAKHWDAFPSLVCCTAVWAGDVRLIDNILIL